jgi:TolB-like protein/Tfp pilus assembly protein PilF
VLPFANIGGDPEQDYFVDGVTESLTTDLSRISGAFVIGRSTAFTYKGKAVDLKQIGRDLKVRYVLEGSVQRGGGRMRINVQLIEAETGGHLWGERFDKPVADLFDMQDEIVSRLANRLGHELAVAEARRAERAINPDSMDHYFLGLANLRKGITAEHQHKARSHLDRALDLDSENVDALVMRAWVDLTVATHLHSDDRSERLRFAEADLGKALRLRPETADAHVALGLLRLQTNRADQGIAECERGLAIDRNHPHAHALIGVGKNLTGRCEETEAHVLEAFRISPHDRRAGMWLMIAGTAKLWAGHDEEALTRLSRSIELDPNEPMRHFYFAAASALLGRMEEAREAARAGLELNPSFTIRWDRAARVSDHPVFLASRERVHEGMRLAGIPEG